MLDVVDSVCILGTFLFAVVFNFVVFWLKGIW